MTPRGKLLLALLPPALLALASACSSNAQKLPALQADLSKTSVSGLSAGGYMAGQFLVAHSGSVIGAAIVAAGPYGCAQSAAAESIPFFPAAVAYNLAQAENGCTADRLSGLGVLNGEGLARRAQNLSDRGKIDPLSGLRRSRVYIYTGLDDRTVVKSVVEATRNFFQDAGVPPANIEFASIPGGHAFLTEDRGNACSKSDPPYIDNCHYDQAGAILSFIYGNLEPKEPPKPENFLIFDQTLYAARDSFLASEGVAYMPSACKSAPGCRVHIVFHGCGQSRADVRDAVTHESGFADWAERNRLIVLFPQAASSTLNPRSCWDWWGYTGHDFLTRDAPQMKSIEAMLQRLAQKP